MVVSLLSNIDVRFYKPIFLVSVREQKERERLQKLEQERERKQKEEEERRKKEEMKRKKAEQERIEKEKAEKAAKIKVGLKTQHLYQTEMVGFTIIIVSYYSPLFVL